MGRRWTEWVSGVIVNHDGPGATLLAARRGIKWKWLRPSSMAALAWCPLCGSVVPPKVHKYRGETALQIHERVCWSAPDDEYADDDEQQLQLESGGDDGTVQQEAE